MKLNFRTYQKTQTTSILKKDKFLFFTIGANQNSTNWVTFEQNLHKLGLAYTKIYNNSTKKIFQNSSAKKLKNTIISTFFFLTRKNPFEIIRSNLINEIEANNLDVIVLKLNKKVYALPQLKKLHTFNYRKNVKILYQFLSTNSKSSFRLKAKN